MPRCDVDAAPNRHCYAAEDLQIDVPAVIARYQRPTDRITTQSSKGDDEEVRTDPHADLADI